MSAQDIIVKLEKELGISIPRRDTANLSQTGGVGYSIENNKIKSLYLRDLKLKYLPEGIFNITSLNELDIGYNNITDMAEGFHNLQNLQVLNMEENKLQSIPDSIFVKNLRELSVFSNELKIVPDQIGSLTNLIHLTLGMKYLILSLILL